MLKLKLKHKSLYKDFCFSFKKYIFNLWINDAFFEAGFFKVIVRDKKMKKICIGFKSISKYKLTRKWGGVKHELISDSYIIPFSKSKIVSEWLKYSPIRYMAQLQVLDL